MPRCASVQNKASTDQCASAAMTGHTLCGKHARMKTPRLWTEVVTKTPIKIQAMYRGWCVRYRLALAGPGVLQRKRCVNDEDLVTMEEKKRQHPFDYFGIEEAGKVWWFDVGTVWEWSIRTVAPTNPYTKVPFEHSDLTRLRKIHLYRRRHRIPVPSPSKDLRENIVRRWTVLAHIFRSYGFDDAHPEQFANITHTNLRKMFQLLIQDIQAMKNPNHRVLGLCARGFTGDQSSTVGYTISSLNLLSIALTDTRSYDIVFLTLSALYRC